jgi:acrylyl-CoA reductase (NADPH)
MAAKESSMEPFRALRIHSENDQVVARIEEIELDDLSDGEVVIRCAWSCVNYKDALAVTGAGKILRSFPLVGGIDTAGTVVSSTDTRYSEGDEVVVTSAGLSETRDGGYAEYARLAADSVIPLAEGFSLRDAMALGTAGFTAALAVHQMEHNGLRPDQGPVAVNGASGGVGSVAIDLLAGRGYEVHAISSKAAATDYLHKLGAAEVLTPAELDMGTRPLERPRWAGAIDNLGGDQLSWFTRTANYGANVASIGLAASHKLETTVMPFILRGVNLLGINAVDTPRDLRMAVWKRLATDLKPRHLEHIINGEIGLDGLQECMQDWLEGKVTGRKLVRLAG